MPLARLIALCLLAHISAGSMKAQTWPSSVGVYHLRAPDAGVPTDGHVSWFDHESTAVAVVVESVERASPSDSGSAAVALHNLASRFNTRISAAKQAREIDDYTLAFTTPDSVVVGGRVLPGWAMAYAIKKLNAVSFHLCYAFVVEGRVIQSTTTIPADGIRTTDMPVFAHNIARKYAEQISRPSSSRTE